MTRSPRWLLGLGLLGLSLAVACGDDTPTKPDLPIPPGRRADGGVSGGSVDRANVVLFVDTATAGVAPIEPADCPYFARTASTATTALHRPFDLARAALIGCEDMEDGLLFDLPEDVQVALLYPDANLRPAFSELAAPPNEKAARIAALSPGAGLGLTDALFEAGVYLSVRFNVVDAPRNDAYGVLLVSYGASALGSSRTFDMGCGIGNEITGTATAAAAYLGREDIVCITPQTEPVRVGAVTSTTAGPGYDLLFEVATNAGGELRSAMTLDDLRAEMRAALEAFLR